MLDEWSTWAGPGRACRGGGARCVVLRSPRGKVDCGGPHAACATPPSPGAARSTQVPSTHTPLITGVPHDRRTNSLHAQPAQSKDPEQSHPENRPPAAVRAPTRHNKHTHTTLTHNTSTPEPSSSTRTLTRTHTRKSLHAHSHAQTLYTRRQRHRGHASAPAPTHAARLG